MIEIRHQFEIMDWFIPDCELKVLKLGVFNPKCGDTVRYFYGRDRSRLWSQLSHSVGRELPSNGGDFFTVLKEEGIRCIDLLRSIRVPQERIGEVCGDGASDQKLFRGTN